MIHTKILSLDLGTHTGFAISANGIIESGSVDFSRYKGSKSKQAEHIGQPILIFHEWLGKIISNDKPDCIVYEAVYRWMSSAAAIAYGSYHGSLMNHAAKNDIPVFGYSPTHIKKFWTGKGNSKKDAMMSETRRRFPALDLKDDNQADAIAILHLHINQTNGTNEINTA